MRAQKIVWGLALVTVIGLVLAGCSEDSRHTTAPPAALSTSLQRHIQGTWEGTFALVWIWPDGREEKFFHTVTLTIHDDSTYSWTAPMGPKYGAGKYVLTDSTLSLQNKLAYVAIFDMRFMLEADYWDNGQYRNDYTYSYRAGRLELTHEKPEQFGWKSASLRRTHTETE